MPLSPSLAESLPGSLGEALREVDTLAVHKHMQDMLGFAHRLSIQVCTQPLPSLVCIGSPVRGPSLCGMHTNSSCSY